MKMMDHRLLWLVMQQPQTLSELGLLLSVF